MTHDRDHRRATNQITLVINFDLDHVFNVSVGNANYTVAEFLDDQLSCISVDRLVLRDHQAAVHQRLNNGAGFLGHTERKFRHHNRWWQLYITDDLFALDIATHCLCTGAVLLALHLRHGALTAAFAPTHRLIDSQLTGTAAVFILTVLLVGFLAVTLGLARRCSRKCLVWRSTTL